MRAGSVIPMTKKSLAALFTAATLALSLTACQSGEVNDDPPAGNNAPTQAAETEEAAPAETEETEEAEAEAPANPVFGETYTWDDGLSVTVAEPAPFEASETAVSGEEENQVSFEVTIVNGTGENYDPALFHSTLQSGSAEGTAIFDSAQKIEGSPTTTLLPDRESTFTIAFGVNDPEDLVMELSPGFEYESVIFTN